MNDLHIIDVINEECGTNIHKSGNDVTISSPFRNDSNPSFRIYYNTNSAYDWGSGSSYNIVQFIMEYRDLSYHSSIEYLQSNYGYEKEQKVESMDSGVSAFVHLSKKYGIKADNVYKAIIDKMNGGNLVEDIILNEIPNVINV